MDITRHTQVRFVLMDDKVVPHRIAVLVRTSLEERFPGAAIDVHVSGATFILLTFNANDFPLHWTDAFMKREVQKILNKVAT